MVQKVDLNDNKNLFVVSVILIAGVGGMVVNIGPVVITEVACALILGILTNLLVNIKSKKEDKAEQLTIEEAVAEVAAQPEEPAAEQTKEENADEKL